MTTHACTMPGCDHEAVEGHLCIACAEYRHRHDEWWQETKAMREEDADV